MNAMEKERKEEYSFTRSREEQRITAATTGRRLLSSIVDTAGLVKRRI